MAFFWRFTGVFVAFFWHKFEGVHDILIVSINLNAKKTLSHTLSEYCYVMHMQYSFTEYCTFPFLEVSVLLKKAAELQTYLNNPTWLNFIGLGEENGKPCIYVYVNKLNIPRSLIPDVWYNMPVKIKRIGKIRPR